MVSHSTQLRFWHQTRFDWCLENCPWNDSESAEEAGEQSRLLREFYEGEKPKVRFGVNFRDMPEAFAKHPERVYRVLEFITTLPEVKTRKKVGESGE